jgi:tRNA-dihydrouridine synthase B
LLKIGQIKIDGFPLILAPLEDVTDFAYRSICKKFGADLMYTEFLAAEALIRDVEKVKDKMVISEEQKPIGIQLFGNNAEAMRRAAEIAESANPDIIDINFGCPVRKIAGKGCGAGLMNNLGKMSDITRAVVKATKLPVTVKTRLGWDDRNKNIVEIAERLQDEGIQAITIHGRTRTQLYKGEADWTLIGEVKNNPRIHIPVIGNGDIDSPEKALEFQKKYNVDAVMIGRIAIGNPWIFKQIQHYYESGEHLALPSISERVEVCRMHLLETIKLRGERSGIFMMRKHYSNYFQGIPDFKAYRLKLVTLESYKEISDVLFEIYWKHK